MIIFFLHTDRDAFRRCSPPTIQPALHTLPATNEGPSVMSKSPRRPTARETRGCFRFQQTETVLTLRQQCFLKKRPSLRQEATSSEIFVPCDDESGTGDSSLFDTMKCRHQQRVATVVNLILGSKMLRSDTCSRGQRLTVYLKPRVWTQSNFKCPVSRGQRVHWYCHVKSFESDRPQLECQ